MTKYLGPLEWDNDSCVRKVDRSVVARLDVGWTTTDEDHAYGRLFAAAPDTKRERDELLEALLPFVAAWMDTQISGEKWYGVLDRIDGAMFEAAMRVVDKIGANENAQG